LRADTLVLSLIKSPSAVGLYGAAYRVIDVLVTIPFIFAGLILPVLTSSWIRKDEANFRRVLQKSLDFMIILALPMVIGTYFVNTQIITIVAGNDFLAAGSILSILIIAAGIIFIGTVFSHAVIALDLQKKIIPAYIFTAVTAIMGYLLFIPTYSYFGAAWVTVYSELAIAFFSFVLVLRYAKFKPNWSILAKSGFAAFLMAALMFTLKQLDPNISLPLLIIFSTVTYFAVLFACKGVKQEDLNILLNK
jgi:O-antigen/teichoic acid export membrane protein